MQSRAAQIDIARLAFARPEAVVPVVVQDATSGAVLMIAFADREAVDRTLETGEMHYRDATGGLWRKGATSGNRQRLVSLTADCDGDALLARVDPTGPACHTGHVSCFGDVAIAADPLASLDLAIAEHTSPMSTRNVGLRASGMMVAIDPDRFEMNEDISSDHEPRADVARLLDDSAALPAHLSADMDRFRRACRESDSTAVTQSAADLLRHLLLAVRGCGGTLDDVRRALAASRADGEASAE